MDKVKVRFSFWFACAALSAYSLRCFGGFLPARLCRGVGALERKRFESLVLVVFLLQYLLLFLFPHDRIAGFGLFVGVDVISCRVWLSFARSKGLDRCTAAVSESG